ncbi:Triglyceride lipase-cholesterol esterase [Handroanthus impetiginosus]|uniref:Cholesterol oxidase n=1 Tax=Handroanthus impetiginosus TaxID=429701 RepID=A0A2G9I4F8_9LAMI|nr:Triglyceride lipase-cholesterol esterase [Handroanthus impetiginosus]
MMYQIMNNFFLSLQSAVIPTAYPSFLFKGVTTYGCQSIYWFLPRIIIDSLKHVLGLNRGQEMVLNAIGHDDSSGKLTFDKDTNRIFFQPPHDHLLPRKVEAFQKLAKKLGGVLFMSRYRSTSVHLLGGCTASSDVSSGVCNPNGQVFDAKSPTGVHPGLYICDASIIPCSVGINPCLTIAAAAEHVRRKLTENKSSNQKQRFISNYKMKKSCNLEVSVKETMRGQVGGMLCAAYLKLRFKTQLLRGKVGGYVECKGIEMDKMYIIHGEVDLCKTDIRTPYTQYMHYNLLIAASSGSRYVLEGKKVMNPYLLALYAWRESTTLNVTLRKITNNIGEKTLNLKGKLRFSLLELLKSMRTLEGGNRSKFIFLLMQSLLRTYILQVPRGSHANFTPSELVHGSYPNSTLHEIKTEVGFIICCQLWKCSHSPQLQQEKKPYPILLINGYSTESYCLPTEPNDLVRTLLKVGHDVWLLRTRLHLSNCSDHFSVEDIGKIDIAAAINEIITFYRESVRVHIVAHCVGGLAIHIALMGGHVSARHIASLSCTNSSMFFKLTTSSLLKMWLPLVPISMAIIGQNKTLPLLQTSPTRFRHCLLKSIARLIPRYERCTCDECEVFSGIFGNTFWHENITQSMHHWTNKENIRRLPMAAFPHLRKICNTGFIVDARGNNSYLIHPERMALPTLYISGGRSLLVTPETSFLANKYMKLHQPGYRHERVVVDGFGHSDLLIGEKSEEEVFPHILKHIALAEEERSSWRAPREYTEEALAWSDDPYKEDWGKFRGWICILITVMLLVVLLKLLFLPGFP